MAFPAKQSKPQTKIVVRRLPPTISAETFWEIVHAVCPPDHLTWTSFVPGKSSFKTVRLGCAYLNFRDPSEVYDFCAKFDGHAFVSDRGAQYRAVVEYAPSQKIPGRARRDKREGTLDQDADFIEFCKRLEVGGFFPIVLCRHGAEYFVGERIMQPRNFGKGKGLGRC